MAYLKNFIQSQYSNFSANSFLENIIVKWNISPESIMIVHCLILFRDTQSTKAASACSCNGTGFTMPRTDGPVRNWILCICHSGRLSTLAMHKMTTKVYNVAYIQHESRPALPTGVQIFLKLCTMDRSVALHCFLVYSMTQMIF